MLVVITYDIANDKRRYQASKVLEDHGTRVLESVFECELTQRQLDRLLARLRRTVEPRADAWRVYPICEACVRRSSSHPPREPQPTVFII